jgi:hypothetical protein
MNKKDKLDETFNPARVAALMGLTIGLGIVVHEGFFLLAGAIAVGAVAVAVVHAVQDHAELAHQPR